MTSPQQLIEGFRRFREQHFVHNDALYRQLVVQGQTPSALVVACCDARVDPSLVLDCAPGDLFVIRNIANLVPPAEDKGQYHGTSAALEFGVRNLGVQHIIVLGHARCGGIRALVQSSGTNNPNSYVDDWMRLAESVRAEVQKKMPDASMEAQAHACEQRAIVVSLRNLMTFPWVRERVEDGTLALHGWYFDIEHGQLLRYNVAANVFEPL